MKKLSLLIALVMGLAMLTSCGKDIEDSTSSGGSSSVSQSSSDTSGTGGSQTDGSSGSSADTSASESSGSSSGTPAVTMPVSNETLKESTSRYGYNTLSAEEKDVYDKILKAVYNYQSTVDFGKAISFETYKKVFIMVYFQETQLFWFRGTLDHFDGDTSQTGNLYYRTDAATAAKMQGEIDAKTKEILQFPSGSTAVDKLKVIHDYLGKHNTFTKESAFAQTIYGSLIEGQTQCEGYAKAMGYLAGKAGIENLLIVGSNPQGASHAWNMVKVDGEWYNIDITWDDPTGHEQDNLDYVRYNYFNVTDAEILNKSHVQDLDMTAFTPPKATATKANYQQTYKLYASSYDEAVKMLKDQLIAASAEKRREIQIKVSSKDILTKLNSDLVDKAGIYTMLTEANKSAKNKFQEGTVQAAKDDNVLTMQFVVKYQ